MLILKIKAKEEIKASKKSAWSKSRPSSNALTWLQGWPVAIKESGLNLDFFLFWLKYFYNVFRGATKLHIHFLLQGGMPPKFPCGVEGISSSLAYCILSFFINEVISSKKKN